MHARRAIRPEAVQEAMGQNHARLVLSRCIRNPLSVKAISDATGIPLASTYRQVHGLVERGLMVVERSAMTPDGKAFDLYRSRLRRARLEVAPDAVHVHWDLNEAVEDRLHHMWDELRM